MSKKSKQQINYLELVPKANLDHQTDESGKVTVLVPRFSSKIGTKLLLPRMKNKYIKLKLDELGSATWLSVDGKKNVGQICDEMKEKFGEKINPAEERVTKFFSQLYLNKFISFNNIEI